MEKFKRNIEVDLQKFNKPEDKLDAKYGLPTEVSFCKRCVISNQRPNSCAEHKHTKDTKKETIHFDSEGVCDACKAVGEKMNSIDWTHRERELIELCDRYRKNDDSYDCLVPGSGGKDSFYAAHILKYKYGMHPLTVTWAPHIYTSWGWNNLQLWIHSGFDNYLCTPNGLVHRLLTRLATENLFHPFQPFIFGQKYLAPKLALNFNIPLVFYGENEAEYGNPMADNNSAKRDWDYFTSDNKDNIYLAGVSIRDLENEFGIDENDLKLYMPADPDRIEKSKVEVHYLGYYLKWHPQGAYYYSVEHGGFEPSPERTPGTYSKYNSIDDKVDDLHYYTTYIKFGIGRATYDAAQEIRHDEITREEGVALVKKFDGEFPERFIDELFEYLSLSEKQYPNASGMFEQPTMNRDYFMHLADRFRSPHLWKMENGIWKLRHTVF
ncbi:N-acetyl sugar amidotransferase [Acetivibrio cellulolyticus]|uniref:N-acetyl sugar amidotransferase n=1 Tax=Acetivibrio cellulolyticus TaxID=35830 RepID=UPI0001E2E34B|nr:N-acetyl sugar amidotransferase [Acetivibrio cellulolyticus]